MNRLILPILFAALLVVGAGKQGDSFDDCFIHWLSSHRPVLSATVKDLSSYEKEYEETRKRIEDALKKYHSNMTASEVEHLSQELESHAESLNNDLNDIFVAIRKFPREEFQKRVQWYRVSSPLNMLLAAESQTSLNLANCKPPHQDSKNCLLRQPVFDTAQLKKEVASLKAKHPKVSDRAKWDQLAAELDQKIKQALKTGKDSADRKKVIAELSELDKELHSLQNEIIKAFSDAYKKSSLEHRYFPPMDRCIIYGEVEILMDYSFIIEDSIKLLEDK